MKTYYSLIMLLLMTLPGCMRELEYPQAEPQNREECRYIDVSMADGSSVPAGRGATVKLRASTIRATGTTDASASFSLRFRCRNTLDIHSALPHSLY